MGFIIIIILLLIVISLVKGKSEKTFSTKYDTDGEFDHRIGDRIHNELEKRDMISNGTWTCSKCNTVNYKYITTCPKCGKAKFNNEESGYTWICPKCGGENEMPSSGNGNVTYKCKRCLYTFLHSSNHYDYNIAKEQYENQKNENF